MNIFSPSNVNNGILVDYSFYVDPSEGSSDDMGKGILDSVNEVAGISIVDMVDMMVRGEMGYKVEEKQAEITNMNIQMTAMNSFKQTMASFNSNTIKQLNNPNALTSYTITNTEPSNVNANIGSNGLDQSVDMNLKVNEVAQAQTLMAGGFSDPTAPLDEGTMVIEFGSYGSGNFDPNSDLSSITIEIKNPMNLYDVANEINAQSNDVNAEVVQNGDGTFSLAMMGTQTGEDSAMRITSTGGGTNDNLNYNGADTSTVTETQPAKNAEYILNGVPMSSPTNNVSHMGIDLTLMAVTDGTVKISSEPNPSAVIENLNSFVSNYNTMIEQWNMLNEMVPDQNFVGSMYNSDISKEVNKELERMWDTLEQSGIFISDLGMTVNPDGTITVNDALLTQNLTENPNLANEILGSTAKLSNSDTYDLVEIGSSTDGEHEIIVDTAPEKAVMTTTPLSNPTTFAADAAIEMNLGGTELTVDIPAGDYTPAELTSLINNQIKAAGATDYTVSLNADGEMVFESADYGTTEFIHIKTAVPELGIAEDDKANGQDVKGYIDGERFIGDGATIKSTSAGTDGLTIKVDPKTLVVGESVTLTTKKGALSHMDDTMVKLTDPLTGIISSEVSRMESQLRADSTDSLVHELSQLEEEQQRWYDFYSDYYSNLSASLAAMDETQNFLDAMFGNDDDD